MPQPSSPPPCDFCAFKPSEVTITRTREGVQVVLRLCGRCNALQQYVLHVSLLESKFGGSVCFTCGAPAQGYAVVHDAQGRFLGRYSVCASCPGRPHQQANQFLQRATPWTPGVLELPPPSQRPLFAALQAEPPPQPASGGRPPMPVEHPPTLGASPSGHAGDSAELGDRLPAAGGRSFESGGHPPAPREPSAPLPRFLTPHESEIEELQQAMLEAVRVEDYERAAALRDEVRRRQAP